jgi:hypothetical protein
MSVRLSVYTAAGEDTKKSTVKERFAPFTAVPIQVNRMCKLSVWTTLNRTGVTRNTTIIIKTNSLTIFVPSSFYLISWCCYSKQKSSRKLQVRHHAKTSLYYTAVCSPIVTDCHVSLIRYLYTDMPAVCLNSNFMALHLVIPDNSST